MSGLPRTFGGLGPVAGGGGGGREFWRRFLRRNQSCCAACGYQLGGLDGPTCPECGRQNSLSELALQANFESALWYLAAGWGLFFAAIVGIPAGCLLIVMGAAAAPDFLRSLTAIGAGIAALILPLWAGAWLRAYGARIHVGWGIGRWFVAAVCWLPCLPLVLTGAFLLARLAHLALGM